MNVSHETNNMKIIVSCYMKDSAFCPSCKFRGTGYDLILSEDRSKRKTNSELPNNVVLIECNDVTKATSSCEQ